MFIEDYNSTEWQEKEIILVTYPNKNKKYGEGVFRFGGTLTLPVLLPRRGWELIKKARGYVYLKPPNGMSEPFTMKVKIPSKLQALEIANACYEKGESWMGQLGEWPVQYLHRYEQQWTKHWSENSESRIEHFSDSPQSTLQIGENGVWHAYLKKDEGQEFVFYETGNYAGKKVQVGINQINPSYLEGGVYNIEQTKYERDLNARKKCIEHYGCNCQICGFDFEKVYGAIGEGFIHVHHIEMISARGGEYVVDPVKDLIPLCANCHAMVHRRKIPFRIEEVREILNR